MEEKSKAPRLSLKKETITKLSSEQMKNIVGGLSGDLEPVDGNSCDNDSCNSQHGATSCSDHSCNC